MRFLGADPTRPPDEVEALVMVELNNRVVKEQRRIEREAGRGR